MTSLPWLSAADREHLERIRTATRSAFRAAIGAGVTEVALLDAPNQVNVGDSLIWTGELGYLDDLGIRIRYAADHKSYDQKALRATLPPGSTVLLHGGGNFGDIWSGHQTHRERVVRELKDYRIVQLPQSILFTDPARAANANRIFAAHPDFHFLVRDAASIERATAQLPDLTPIPCHDAAFGFTPEPVDQKRAKTNRVMLLAREDRESASGLADLPHDWIAGGEIDVLDWHNAGAAQKKWTRAREKFAALVGEVAAAKDAGITSTVHPKAHRLLIDINAINVASGAALYSPSRAIVVDRLHAHILAILLGFDHVLLDNTYGKLRAAYDATTGVFSTGRFAEDLDEAHDLASDLFRR